MVAVITNPTSEARYDRFVAELTTLTRKYGVAIQSVGGVHIADDPKDFAGVRYIADISSGDLLIDWPEG